jgi:hypothetical protein
MIITGKRYFLLFFHLRDTHTADGDTMGYTMILALLVVFLTIIYWYLKQKYKPDEDRLKALPGPKPEWYFGNLRNIGLLFEKRPT